MYKLYENILNIYVDEIDDFSEWFYMPIKLHFDCWEIGDYAEMTALYREMFGKPNGFEYLDVRLSDLKRVLNIVTEYPGIDRADIYQRLGLNGRKYGGIISSVLVANNLIIEEQLKSKRLLYPIS